MDSQKYKIQCSRCGRLFLAPQREEEPAEAFCRECAPVAKGRYSMILIETQEHRRLLSLYHAAFEAERNPASGRESFLTELEKCDRFFGGGGPCRK